jgi:hypothetical protein
MNRSNRLNRSVDDANWIRRNLVLSSTGGTPQNLSLERVQLQSVGVHPGSNIVRKVGKTVSKGRDIRRPTAAVHLSVIIVSVEKKQMTPNDRK